MVWCILWWCQIDCNHLRSINRCRIQRNISYHQIYHSNFQSYSLVPTCVLTSELPDYCKLPRQCQLLSCPSLSILFALRMFEATFIHFVRPRTASSRTPTRQNASSSVLLIAACKKFPPVISPTQGCLTPLVMVRKWRGN